MLGKCPSKLEPPDPETAEMVEIPNGKDISLVFGSCPPASYEVDRTSSQKGDYRVLIKKPNGKLDPAAATKRASQERRRRVIESLRSAGCAHPDDFTIWVFEPDGSHWMPGHLHTLQAFSKLQSADKTRAFHAIKGVVIDYLEPADALKHNSAGSIEFEDYALELVLKYLKWMAVLEDTLYPSECGFLGRKMAFAGYVLIHSGVYFPSDLGTFLRIW